MSWIGAVVREHVNFVNVTQAVACSDVSTVPACLLGSIAFSLLPLLLEVHNVHKFTGLPRSSRHLAVTFIVDGSAREPIPLEQA